MIKLRADVELKDTIMVAMPKLVGDRNNISSSGKKKQAAVASKEGHSTSAGKGPNSDMFLSHHRFLNVATSGTSTTPIVERINKIERQIIVKKLTIVDDDGKPLAKVVSTVNMDSDSEVEDVVDDRGYRHVKVLKFFDCLSPRQGVEDLRELLHKDTTKSTYLVNRSPSSGTRFKKSIDMLGFFGWPASIKQGILEPVYVKCIFLGYHKSIVGNKLWRYRSVQVLQGVEFEVKPQEDHKFKVEPYRNVDHVVDSHEVQTQDLIYYYPTRDREQYSACELFSYREDFEVAAVEKIYAHELLTFNDTVAYDALNPNCRVQESNDVNNDTIDEYAAKLSGIASKSATLEEVTLKHKLLKKFLTNRPRWFVHIVAPLEQVTDLETTRFKDVVERLKAGDRFAVAAVEKIYAHELLTFNDTVAYDVISKWKARLKEDMDVRSYVYVLSNVCRKSSNDSHTYY
nr:zinc finger, CCHC-type [Tanacetum cinerariifolium]